MTKKKGGEEGWGQAAICNPIVVPTPSITVFAGSIDKHLDYPLSNKQKSFFTRTFLTTRDQDMGPFLKYYEDSAQNGSWTPSLGHRGDCV